MPDFDQELIAYQRNAWAAMVAVLASELGVSVHSLVAIGVGWMPMEACWVFPERNAEGKIVGLVRRFRNGKKLSTEGSKRGLTYAISPDWQPNASDYTPGAQNWTKASVDYPCPICGKPDWCLLSSENPADPKAVICGRKAEGATQPLGDAGYLHVRKEAGKVSKNAGSGLSASPLPVLIVEGQSDVAAAFDLGYVAIGKPSASGGLADLSNLVIGRDVVIVGENDAGAGRLGMEKTFEALRSKAKSCRKILPPDEIKDLRAWIRAGLTAAALGTALLSAADTSSSDLLESTAPMDIADRWLRERHWFQGRPLLRLYAGSWYRWDGSAYAKIEKDPYIRGGLYSFFRGKTEKRIVGKELSIQPFEATAHKVSDVVDALSEQCPVYVDPPAWLSDGEEHPRREDTISFSNGLLILPSLELQPLTPDYFALASRPYGWNPSALCPRWDQFLTEIFPYDPEKVALLQEWFGYNLVPDTSQEKLMFFVGRPGAGKGTVLEALRAILGPANVGSTSFDTITGDFGLQPLLGKLAAILPDAHITRRGDPAKALQILKEISGQDSVAVNRKNKEFLSDHRMSCRFTISVNAMPDLPDHERSLDRRLLLLHFGESFAGREDTGLKAKIAAEAVGIAIWAVAGLLRLRQQGFTTPRSSTPIITDFRRQSSPITEFGDVCCLFGEDKQTPFNMLYDAYRFWCRDQGIQVCTATKFSIRFHDAYPGCFADKFMFSGRQVRGMMGVVLTDEAAERYLVGRKW